MPYRGGVTFRVWAKFASSVSVAGTFNNWSTPANPLAFDGGGYWSVDVAGVKAGDHYKFFMPESGLRVDPYASSVFEDLTAAQNGPMRHQATVSGVDVHFDATTGFTLITALYRDMIRLRRNWFNNTRGLQGPNLQILPVFADNMLAYHRWGQGGAGDDVVVVCNFSSAGYADYAIGLPCGGMWQVRFNSDAAIYDSSFSNWESLDTMADGAALNGMPCSGNIGIGPYSCIVLSQDQGRTQARRPETGAFPAAWPCTKPGLHSGQSATARRFPHHNSCTLDPTGTARPRIGICVPPDLI